MLAFICAQCGETSYDFVDGPGHKQYHIKCKRCGAEFTAEVRIGDRQDNGIDI